jgi:hypothetical protein
MKNLSFVGPIHLEVLGSNLSLKKILCDAKVLFDDS